MNWLTAMSVVFFIGMPLTPSQGADWRNTLDVKPGKFPTLRALTAHYEFGWSGLKAAEADAKFTHPKSRHRLDLTTKTTGAARALWQMDTTATSSVNASTLRAVKVDQTETYDNKSFRTTVDFSAEGVKRLRTPTPADKTPAKVKRFKLRNVHDLHSALLFIRSQRLRDGDGMQLCVYASTSPYLVDVTVQGHGKISAAGREWDAIRCDLNLRAIEKDFTLSPYKKFKRATAWLSDDADRLLLRIEAEVFIGSVWAELKSVEFSK